MYTPLIAHFNLAPPSHSTSRCSPSSMEVETWKRIGKQQIQNKTNLHPVEVRTLPASATMTELIAKQVAVEAATRTKLMQGQMDLARAPYDFCLSLPSPFTYICGNEIRCAVFAEVKNSRGSMSLQNQKQLMEQSSKL
ncbi:hypothetical protein EJ110_NYTH56313 [Nymphaea thermarum]|nr:hypothetical protein EJ110_NYTH56313 [Nymphaea thermarum]